MGKQANILSFDEAKRSVAAPRSSASARSRSRAESRRAPGTSTRRGAASGDRRGAASTRGVSSPALVQVPRSTAARRSGDGAYAASSRAAVTSFSTSSDYSRAGTSTRRVGARDVRANRFAPERDFELERELGFDLGFEDQEQTEEPAPEKRSRWQEFRRKHQKDRADKKFDKQFGGNNAPASDASGGPRAAVYKGEMGATHRRSARMQNDAPAASAQKKRTATSEGRLKRRLVASGVVTLCLVMTCWFLYTPAQQLYHSVREHDRLQAEYAAIEQRNASLESEVNALQTDAGVEDRAHQEFGWVKEGEQTANVKGLTPKEDESTFTANIIPGSVKAPETWYSPLLDAVFGVQ